MISAVKETPRTERKHDVPAKLQSLDKSRVQHLYPGIVNTVVAPRASGRQKAGEGEDEAGGRGQPLSESFCESAKFCQGHVVSQSLLTMRSEGPQTSPHSYQAAAGMRVR